MMIEDRADLGLRGALQRATQTLMNKARQSGVINPYQTFSSFQINVPQLYADVDRVKAKQQAVAITDIFETMQIYLGSLYVNDFNRFGRTYQVIAQADAPYRQKPEDISQFKTRNSRGEMVPARLADAGRAELWPGPRDPLQRVSRPRISTARPRPGFSSGQAQATMEALAKQTLPNGITYEWTELTYQQILAGDTMFFIFPLCVLLAFLVLTALYESWTLPLAVVMIVPMGLLSAIFGVWVFGHFGAGRRQQHLHADRVHRAGRTGVQERDPDRGVRARARDARARAWSRPRWRPRGCGCDRS